MKDDRINPETITGKIFLKIFQLLAENPEGLQWRDLLIEIEKSFPDFHPKTINGCVWQLVNKFPDKVHKPSKGRFQLIQD
jgi:hypothetical protein